MGFGGLGDPGDPRTLILAYLFFYILLFAVLIWLAEWTLDRIRRILEKYGKLREAFSELEEKNPEKRKFSNLTDALLVFLVSLFTPSLLSHALKNISVD